MAQCQSPEELMKLISRIVDAMVNQYLLCGTLQGGLVACGENAYLPKDTEVVLCRQLYELVQDGIDTGKIVAPTVVEVRYEGSTLILHLANGENLTLDLKPLIDGVIDQAFTDCDGQPIHVGTALATCANLEAVKLALETKLADLEQKVDNNKELTDQDIATLDQKVDHNKELTDQDIATLDQKVDHNKELTDQDIINTKALLEQAIADTKELLEQQIAANKGLSDQADEGLNQRIDDWITDITERMTLLDESITNKIDAATAEWANTVLQQLIEQFLETRQVYHDESLVGDGHEAAPLKVDVTWLRNQITAHLPEVVKFTDCCGNAIAIGDVLVTCACLETQLTSLTNELKAYAEQQAADVLTEANNYTDEQISNIDVAIPYLRNGLATGTEPLVSVDGLALGYNTNASSTGSTAIGNDATTLSVEATAIGHKAMTSGSQATAIGHKATTSGSHATALGSSAKASGVASTALGSNAEATSPNTTVIGQSASASGAGATALGYRATTSSSNTTAVGKEARAAADSATAIGCSAQVTSPSSTALGRGASASYSRSTALGTGAAVTGQNQVQLGNATTTTYAYGAVQDRSDKRDKTDVHNSDLGLEFIQKLRPVKFQWDYRDDYINELFPKPKREDFIDTSVVNEADYLVEITDVVREPDEPNLSEADFESTESYELAQQAVNARNLERQAKYEEALQARREEQLANLAQAKLLVQEQQEAAYAQALQAHQAERIAFMQNPDERKDGSKARQRYHYGLIADELKSTMDELGVDFGGYQDHGINGGMCVKSVGYTELISPLIKAVQELSAQVDDLKQQLKGNQSRTKISSTSRLSKTATQR